MLVQIDGTLFDWLKDGRMFTLHMAVDDATKDILSKRFTPIKCMFSYCKMIELLIKKKGIPLSIYSDKQTIYKSLKNKTTKFGMMMDTIR